MVEIAPIDPAHPHAQHCLRAYFSELDRRFDTDMRSESTRGTLTA
jgi:hypothetical protein